MIGEPKFSYLCVQSFTVGYYQNEKTFGSTQAEPMSVGVEAVNNPEYFDGRDIEYDEEEDVWEPKKPTWNGYQPIPVEPTSPLHTSKEKVNGYPYYNQVENKNDGPVSPTSSTTMTLPPLNSERRPSESMV